MDRSWDVPDWNLQKEWLFEAYRVLKPDGVVKAFSGARTIHRLTASMIEVGFSSIQVETWYYRNGFPKSLDLSKEYDRLAGAEREIIGWKWTTPKGVLGAENRTKAGAGSFGGETKRIPITLPKTDTAKEWEGWYTSIKPSFEPVVVGYKKC